MDSTDSMILFDAGGICNHCQAFDAMKIRSSARLRQQKESLARIIEEIKQKGKGREYDCLIGVSGGADSTFVVYQLKKLSLRPLAVHLDNGWDSELAVSNIEKVLNKLEIKLFTYMLDWDEFRDLQISFLKASVPDAEVPTDHAIVASLYRVADRMQIPYIISGSNVATEAILPSTWTYGIDDWVYIQDIQKRFGTVRLSSYPHYSQFKLLYYRKIKNIKTICLLDYLEYEKEKAIKLLEKEFGWRNYGGKHYESIYTRFFQGYILPKKFTIDKRKAHLSTLICSKQITRSEALATLRKDPYPENLFEEDKKYVLKKLSLSVDEFEQIMRLPVKTHSDYTTFASSNNRLFSMLLSLNKIVRNICKPHQI